MNREIYGLVVGVLSLLAITLPTAIFAIVVGAISFLMGRELSKALDLKDVEFPSFLSPILFYAAQPLGGVFVSAMALAYGYKLWNLDTFFKVAFVLFYVGFFPAFLISVREVGIFPILLLLLMTWANDVLAYYVGRRFGKRPMFPKISPNKTYEGFLAGVLGGTIVFTLLSPYSIFDSLLIGVVTLCVGVAGDYFKSFIKRQVGVKDFSNILGGHGGFLDRFDSLIFSAPIYYWLIT